LLKTPHFKQPQDGMCLPTCVRMVLAHWGETVSEAKLVKVLGTKQFGTPISNVTRLSQLGYRVDFGPLTPEQLQTHINEGQPVIAQLWTMMLTYWPNDSDSSHIVVVVGFDETHVYLNDPAFEKVPQPLLWDGFLAAWAEFDETAVVLST